MAAGDSGIRCYRLGRLIAASEFFGHPVPAQFPGLARLVGEVEVPVVPLTMNKSDFDRDSDPWIEVESRMHRLLVPAVRRLARASEHPPSPGALRAADQARRLLSQALRLMDRPELFPGFATARDAAEPGRLDATPVPPDQLPFDGPPEAEVTARQPRDPHPRLRLARAGGVVSARSWCEPWIPACAA